MINSMLLILVLVCLIVCADFVIPSVLDDNEGGVLAVPVTNCLRGIAIMMIMASHVSGSMHTVILTPFGGTGVALFLFLSGYGLTRSTGRYGLERYWWKKINRVLLPYAIVVTVLSLAKWHLSVPDYLLNIFGIRTSYWYIAYAMKWYLFYWLTTRFFHGHRTVLMALVATMMLFILPNIEAEQSYSFLAGVIAATHLDKLNALSKRRIVMIAACSFLFGTACLALKQLPAVRDCMGTWIYNVVQLGIKLPYAIAIISVVVLFSRIVRNPFLAFAGVISYELYLVHMPFYVYVNGSLLYALLLFVLSIAVAYAFKHVNDGIGKALNVGVQKIAQYLKCRGSWQ